MTDPPSSPKERDELADLVAALRAALTRHQRAGRWAAPAGPSPRSAWSGASAAGAPSLDGNAEAVAAPLAASSTIERPNERSSERPVERSRERPVDAASPSSDDASPAGRFDDVPLPSDDLLPPEADAFDGPMGEPALDRSSDRGARGARPGHSGRGDRADRASPDPGRGLLPVIDDDFTPRRSARTLATVRAELGDCQRCKLARTRQKLVFGAGAADAALVFVGEAPGADEDRTGEPFVGRAGELLDKMIEAMGWTRASVYIANLLKCRPPGNRNPEPDEAKECRPFLIAQLEVIAPRIIVALGRPSANALLGVDAPISTLRGKFHERRGIRIMPTFHPAYLLREPGKKRDAWADLKLVMQELDRIGVAAPARAR